MWGGSGDRSKEIVLFGMCDSAAVFNSEVRVETSSSRRLGLDRILMLRLVWRWFEMPSKLAFFQSDISLEMVL